MAAVSENIQFIEQRKIGEFITVDGKRYEITRVYSGVMNGLSLQGSRGGIVELIINQAKTMITLVTSGMRPRVTHLVDSEMEIA